MGRVVAAYAHRGGSRIAEIQLGESASWAREKGDFVWIGFHEPTEQDLRTLQAQFGLHELAVEDALHTH
jgi:magnesium transporter